MSRPRWSCFCLSLLIFETLSLDPLSDPKDFLQNSQSREENHYNTDTWGIKLTPS